MISQPFKEFVDLLNKYQVEFLIVGGYAVGYYGYPRYTGDLDIWIKISEENAERLMQVMDKFPAPKNLFSKQDFMNKNPLSGGFFGREPFRIDILNSIDGVNFDECFVNANRYDFEGTEMPFIHYNDLKKNKLASGRTKDKLDIEEIEKKRNTQ